MFRTAGRYSVLTLVALFGVVAGLIASLAMSEPLMQMNLAPAADYASAQTIIVKS